MRFQKLHGQAATFLQPLIQLLAIDRAKAQKSPQTNQRAGTQRAKDQYALKYS